MNRKLINMYKLVISSVHVFLKFTWYDLFLNKLARGKGILKLLSFDYIQKWHSIQYKYFTEYFVKMTWIPRSKTFTHLTCYSSTNEVKGIVPIHISLCMLVIPGTFKPAFRNHLRENQKWSLKTGCLFSQVKLFF